MRVFVFISAAAIAGFFLFSKTSPVKGTRAAHAADSTRYSIDNCVNVFTGANVESTKVGYQYWFVDKNFAGGKTLKMSVVGPHEATHPPHHHAEDEFFFILEGKAEFYLDGRTKVVGPYSSLYCPPNMEHGIRNVGDKELRYLVIKKYETKGN